MTFNLFKKYFFMFKKCKKEDLKENEYFHFTDAKNPSHKLKVNIFLGTVFFNSNKKLVHSLIVGKYSFSFYTPGLKLKRNKNSFDTLNSSGKTSTINPVFFKYEVKDNNISMPF